MLHEALSTMPSIKHLPRHGFPDATSGHPGLGHPDDLNGSLRAISWRMGGPGFSSTLTVVPFGPLTWATAILSLLARVESLVTGTVKVAVAPSFLNQELLSAFCTCALCSLLLYRGLFRW